MLYVWRIAVSEFFPLVPTFLNVLSRDEQKIAASLRIDRDRLAYVVSHYAVRHILAQCTDKLMHNIQFTADSSGKPSLVLEKDERRVFFNLAHSGNWALCAVSFRGHVGVDIERVDPAIDSTGIAKECFSSAESLALSRLPLSMRVLGFYECWVRKEAFLKAIGTGMRFDLRQFTVSADPRVNESFVISDFDTRAWKTVRIPIPGQYRASLCYSLDVHHEQAAELKILDWLP